MKLSRNINDPIYASLTTFILIKLSITLIRSFRKSINTSNGRRHSEISQFHIQNFLINFADPMQIIKHTCLSYRSLNFCSTFYSEFETILANRLNSFTLIEIIFHSKSTNFHFNFVKPKNCHRSQYNRSTFTHRKFVLMLTLSSNIKN